MYNLTVEAHFDAAHRLPDYNGPCRRVHGHRWVVKANYTMFQLDHQGMAYDLVILKQALRAIVVTLDHRSLNDTMSIVPTAENIARMIYQQLQALPDPVHHKYLNVVTVYETPDTSVSYTDLDEKQHRTVPEAKPTKEVKDGDVTS